MFWTRHKPATAFAGTVFAAAAFAALGLMAVPVQATAAALVIADEEKKQEITSSREAENAVEAYVKEKYDRRVDAKARPDGEDTWKVKTEGRNGIPFRTFMVSADGSIEMMRR